MAELTTVLALIVLAILRLGVPVLIICLLTMALNSVVRSPS